MSWESSRRFLSPKMCGSRHGSAIPLKNVLGQMLCKLLPSSSEDFYSFIFLPLAEMLAQSDVNAQYWTAICGCGFGDIFEDIR